MTDGTEFLEDDYGVSFEKTNKIFPRPGTLTGGVTTYCCGFLFDLTQSLGRQIVLIRKKKSDFQHGRLNGIGGKVELCETPEEAMIREFAEKAGKTVHVWQPVAVLHGARFGVVHFFRAFGSLAGIHSTTDEAICVRTASVVVGDPTLMDNLRVLIPLALDDTIVKPVVLNDGERA